MNEKQDFTQAQHDVRRGSPDPAETMDRRSPLNQRPAGNQFTLRGMFLVTTAVCVIMALLALAIRQPLHWLGMLGVIAFCLVVIGLLELGRLLFPPKPRFPYYVPPVARNPLQTAYFSDGESPFAPSANDTSNTSGDSPFGPPPEQVQGQKEGETERMREM